MKLLILASAICAAALTGAAGPRTASVQGVDTAAAAGSRQCFARRDVRNHTVGDARTLYLDINGREVWKVQMSNSCLASAVSSDPLIFRNDTGSQSVCRPIDLDITVSAAGPSRCIVSSISKLTAAEVAALPKKMRP